MTEQGLEERGSEIQKLVGEKQTYGGEKPESVSEKKTEKPTLVSEQSETREGENQR